MIQIKTSDENASILRSQYPDKIVKSNPGYVVQRAFDELQRNIRRKLTSISGPLYTGEIDQYFWPLISQLTQQLYKFQKKPQAGASADFVMHQLNVRSIAYAVMHEIISLSQNKTIQQEMNLSLATNTQIFQALSSTTPPQALNVLSGTTTATQQAAAVNNLIKFWLGTPPYGAGSTSGISKAWPSQIANIAPDQSTILAVASEWLSPAWKDSSGVAQNWNSELTRTLGDYYAELLQYAGRGKGYPLTRAKRTWTISSYWAVYNMLIDMFKTAQSAGLALDDDMTLSLFSLTYMFDWFLEQKLSESDLFPTLAFQVNSIGWAQTVRTLSRRLSDFYNTFSRIPLSLQYCYLRSEAEDALQFASPFLGNSLWLEQINASLSEADKLVSGVLVEPVVELIKTSKAAYADLFPNATVVSAGILMQWDSTPATSFKKRLTDPAHPVTPVTLANMQYFDTASAIMKSNRDYVAIQLADLAISLRSTAFYTANHMSILAMTKVDAIQPTPPITLTALPDKVGTPQDPQVWDFQEHSTTSFLANKWVYDPAAPIFSSKWVLSDAATSLTPQLSSAVRNALSITKGELLPYFRSLGEVPLASPLTKDYFSQPLPYTYVARWIRRKKKLNINNYLRTFNPPDLISHSDDDKFISAARLLCNPARGMAQAIIDATAGMGTWYVAEMQAAGHTGAGRTSGYLERALQMVDNDRAARSKSDQSKRASINAKDLWSSVLGRGNELNTAIDDLIDCEFVYDDTLYTHESLLDSDEKSLADGTTQASATMEDGTARPLPQLSAFIPLRPSIPFLYGVPTDAMLKANLLRIDGLKDLKKRAVVYCVLDPSSNVPMAVMFVLHRVFPHSLPTRFISWETVEGYQVPVSVDAAVYDAICSQSLAQVTKKDDELTSLTDSEMAAALNAAIYTPNLAKTFSAARWKGAEAICSAKSVEQQDKLLKATDSSFFSEAWMYPESLVLPHISMTHLDIADDVLADIRDAERFPLMRRVVPNTGDMELRMFFSDTVVMLERSDLESANRSTDPSPLSATSAAETTAAPDVTGNPSKSDIDGHRAMPTSQNAPELGSSERASGTPQGAVSFASEAGRSATDVIIEPSSNANKSHASDTPPSLKVSDTAKGKESGALTQITEAAGDEGAIVPNALINTTRKDSALNKLAGESATGDADMSRTVQITPTAMSGDPEKKETTPDAGGAGASASGHAAKKVKKYGKKGDGVWDDVIEVEEGQEVPDGYVPCGDAKVGDKI